MTKNQFVAEKLGLCWHEITGHWFCQNCEKQWGESIEIGSVCSYCACPARYYVPFPNEDQNPDFSTDAGAVQLLRLILGKQFMAEKLQSILQCSWDDRGDCCIPVNLITTPGALLDAVADYFGWKEVLPV